MLRLRTFGGVALRDDDRLLDGPATQRRRLALLAMLAVAGEAGVSRDKLIAHLWPESDTERARHSLRQWIFLLRRDLGADDILLGTTDLRLDPQFFTSDVADFERALSTGDDDAAVAAYDGPFLDGFHLNDAGEFERWMENQRNRYASRFGEAMERVARTRSASGDLPGAAAAWRRLASADPCNARIAVQVMNALEAAGDRAGALAHARVHAALVREELGAEPDRKVLALAEQLRTTPEPAKVRVIEAPTIAAPAVIAPSAPRVPSETVASPGIALTEQTRPTKRLKPARRRWRRRLMSLGITPLLGVVLLGLSRSVPVDIRANLWTLVTRGSATIAPRRILVAPLENHTGDTALVAFGELAADYIADYIARAGDFDVVDARTSLINSHIVDGIPRFFRSGDRSIALAEETGAARVVSGRYYKDGDSLRVQVQMIDVRTHEVIRRAGAVAGSLHSVGALVDQLSHRVGAMVVSATDTSAAGTSVAVTAPPSLEVYREASLAWEAYFRSDLDEFFRHAARASAMDSAYMTPVAMQAHVRSEMRDWARVDSLAHVLDVHRRTLSRIELSALELFQAQLRGDIDGQLRAAGDVASASPASSEMRTYLAHMAVNANRPHAALDALRNVDSTRGAMFVIPWYWNWKTAALHELGDHAHEVESAKRGVAQFPSNQAAMLNLGRALSAIGDISGLEDLTKKLPSSTPKQRWFRAKMLLDWSRELDAHRHPAESKQLIEKLLAEAGSPDTDAMSMQTRIGALMFAERWSEAERLVRRELASAPLDVTARGQLGVIAAATGDRATAERINADLASTTERYLFGRHTLWRARIAATLGDRELAATLAQAAFAQGHPRFFDPAGGPYEEPEYHIDSAFRVLRGHPSYERLITPRD